ncbi:unnamed protein product, partial [Iphiclides podalirius]
MLVRIGHLSGRGTGEGVISAAMPLRAKSVLQRIHDRGIDRSNPINGGDDKKLSVSKHGRRRPQTSVNMSRVRYWNNFTPD